MIFQMIYTCALAQNVTREDLDGIAETSRLRNVDRDVTGILLCKDGSVLQVLEGARETVEELYNKIASDPRVTSPLVLIRRVAKAREFPNWSMGYRNADHAHAAFDLSAKSFWSVLPANSSRELGTISRTFARVNGLA